MESSVGRNGAAPALVPHEGATCPFWSSPSPLPAPQPARARATIAIAPRTRAVPPYSRSPLLERSYIPADLATRAAVCSAMDVEVQVVRLKIRHILRRHLRSRDRR